MRWPLWVSAATRSSSSLLRTTDNGVVGAQHLQNAAASLHAAVDAVHQHGTHAVIIARVMVAHSTDVEPLVYVRRRYGRVVSPNPGCDCPRAGGTV